MCFTNLAMRQKGIGRLFPQLLVDPINLLGILGHHQQLLASLLGCARQKRHDQFRRIAAKLVEIDAHQTVPSPLLRLQRSEQYRTLSQSRAHFLRQLNGRLQDAQILLGKSAFLRIFGISQSP
jgi:hypothetical protein